MCSYHAPCYVLALAAPGWNVLTVLMFPLGDYNKRQLSCAYYNKIHCLRNDVLHLVVKVSVKGFSTASCECLHVVVLHALFLQFWYSADMGLLVWYRAGG